MRQGWLLKKGPKGGGSGAPRWVVLSDDKAVAYYRDDKSKKALGTISLGDVSRAFDVERDEYTLFVHTDARVYEFVATSVVVACEWWHALLAAGGRAVGADQHQSLSPLSADHANAKVITDFYTAFSAKDWATMAATYDDGATFSDPVFPSLDARHVRAMWRMFCERGKDFSVQFKGIMANELYAIGHWEADYRFSKTGNMVHNVIDATFILNDDGKIIRHVDAFSFHKWSAQALGGVGRAIGWTSALNKKVTAGAITTLNSFIEEIEGGDSGVSGSGDGGGAAAGAADVPEQVYAPFTPVSDRDGGSTAVPMVVTYVEKFTNFSADEVWAVAGEWSTVHEWSGVVLSAELDDKCKQKPPASGAVRGLIFKRLPDMKFEDRLIEHNGEGRTLRFETITTPLPMQNHTTVFTVTPIDDGGGEDDDDVASCLFEWNVSFTVAPTAPAATGSQLVLTMRNLQLRAARGLRREVERRRAVATAGAAAAQ